MAVNTTTVGTQIAELRKAKNLTQAELGERLVISPQAVSNWERGESLPDTAILPSLADVLETSIDSILRGGERVLKYRRRVSVADIIAGIGYFDGIKESLGDTLFWKYAVKGIDEGMNLDLESYLGGSFEREALYAEAVCQSIAAGAYVDISDVRKHFERGHFANLICDFAAKYGIK